MVRQGILSLFREGLRKTRESLAGRLEGLWAGHSQVDEEFYEELEAILLQADVGVETTRELLSGLRERSRRQAWRTPEDVRLALQQQVEELLRQGGAGELARAATPPTVVLVVGVNGTGKTTSIGKLAYWLRSRGHKVMLGAADTFRAAAGEQLEVWA
ncbi:MAG: signal recognition particle receptor subunit alpha, partial [Firmicutes bacterium]|nr:signal recognition particle receptor subunit alpha [Bacillota bacterium]